MASEKKLFAPGLFAPGLFAPGLWRGSGVDPTGQSPKFLIDLEGAVLQQEVRGAESRLIDVEGSVLQQEVR